MAGWPRAATRRPRALARRILRPRPGRVLGPRTVAASRAIAVVGVVVCVDQLAKAAIVSALRPRESLHLFAVFGLSNIRNTGVAFGMFSGLGSPVVVLSLLALAVPVAYFIMHPTQRLLWLPVGMILGGALGNLADRERAGAVIDFINVSIWPAFNLADAAIVCGVIGLLYLIETSARSR